MNIVMFGAPGVGKGTHARHLVKLFNIPHISTGDMFRFHIENDTEIGKKVKQINNGGFASDEIVTEMVKDRLQQQDAQNGFILDGYPRTIPQISLFENILSELKLKTPYFIDINASKEALLERIKGRSEKENREDDRNTEVVYHRLNIFLTKTVPCINYFKKYDTFIEIDGNDDIETVDKKIETELIKRIPTFKIKAKLY